MSEIFSYNKIIESIIIGLLLCGPASVGMAADHPGLPVVYSFQADPGITNPGENVTLTWNVSDAKAVLINPGGIYFEAGNSLPDLPEGDSLLVGSAVVQPKNGTNYTLDAWNDFGNTTANNSVIVRGSAVGLIAPKTVSAPKITVFRANPASIKPGDAATLVWSVSNAAEVSITGIGRVALSGSMAVMPTQTTTYVLTARRGSETAKASVSVAVVLPKISKPAINSFRAHPASIRQGEGSTLSWSVSGASRIVIDPGVGYVVPTGYTQVVPATDTVYTLTAQNSAGISTASAKVSVKSRPQPPRINYFMADKSVISRGDSATLSWSVSGAESVVISGIGSVRSSGSMSVRPSYTAFYTLTATNGGGSDSANAYIEVGEVAIQPIIIPPQPRPREEPITILPIEYTRPREEPITVLPVESPKSENGHQELMPIMGLDVW
ncbi:MAG: immunoglobulin domain-containing protein [Methanothrix sp.]|nr:MAG: immunoglobulin domain-containing protein [Methanothrix sp.]